MSNGTVVPPPLVRRAVTLDLLALPGLGRFLRWRHARTALQVPLLLVGLVMVLDGLGGPQLSPKNLATVLTWIHYRGFVVLALLVAGNLFCMACPFMLPRNLARRFFRPARMWPRQLRNKWLSVVLLVLFFFVYELFDLWATPWWTAWLIVAYFAAALVVDSLFRGASFCKYLCPIGQFNYTASLLSPLEVKVRNLQVCATCHTKDCIRGRGHHRGCELWLFQERKVGNMDCTFCLDCVHACPYDNVGLLPRLPGSELWTDPWRSGVGRFSRRPDLAALVTVFTFGALLNAFGMISPVYALEAWLSDLLGTRSEVPVLALIFVTALVVEPIVLLGLAAWVTQAWAGVKGRLVPVATRYAFALVPLGFGVWLAHYGFHFLTGFLTIVPVMQSALADLGGPLLGAPRWDLGPVLPIPWLYPVELGFMGLGWLGSLLVAYRLAVEDAPEHPWRAFLPWAGLSLLLLLTATWLMAQPMEMRATFLGG
jgi:ferredoxin